MAGSERGSGLMDGWRRQFIAPVGDRCSWRAGGGGVFQIPLHG